MVGGGGASRHWGMLFWLLLLAWGVAAGPDSCSVDEPGVALSFPDAVLKLTAGQTIDAGEVNVEFDGDCFHFEVDTNSKFLIKELHIGVYGSCDLLPLSGGGIKIGQLPINKSFSPAVDSTTASICVADIPNGSTDGSTCCGDELCAVVHTALKGINGQSSETGYACPVSDGDVTCMDVPGRNWALKFTGRLECRECFNDDECNPTDDTTCGSQCVLDTTDQIYKCSGGDDCLAGDDDYTCFSGSHPETCKPCVDSAPGSHIDDGCQDNEGTPICAVFDASGDALSSGSGKPGAECKTCINDEMDDSKDTGCSTSKPLCDGETDQFGDNCFVCQNTEDEGDSDLGCNDPSKPDCVAGPGGFGNQCKCLLNCSSGVLNPATCTCETCKDSAKWSNKDAGCDSSTKLCGVVNDNGFAVNSGEGEFGDVCKKCINNKADDSKDVGCSSSMPLCDGDFKKFGDACFLCQNTEGTGDSDLGCNDPSKPDCVAAPDGFGTQCKCQLTCDSGVLDTATCTCGGCADDAKFANKDTGCDSSTKLCGVVNDNGFAVNSGEGAVAEECKKCINNKADDSKDVGCSSSLPLCDGGFKKFGDACFLCQNTEEDARDLGCNDAGRPNCRASMDSFGLECFGFVCQLKDTDICFAIDESGSIKQVPGAYDSEKAFVTSFVSAFDSAKGTSTLRYGGLEFQTTTNLINGGSLMANANNFMNTVDALEVKGGYTNIYSALEECDGILDSGGAGKGKILVLLTDGVPTRGIQDPDQIISLADGFKSDGTTIVTVGAGDIDEALLESIASDNLAFIAADVTSYDDIVAQVIRTVCEEVEI